MTEFAVPFFRKRHRTNSYKFVFVPIKNIPIAKKNGAVLTSYQTINGIIFGVMIVSRKAKIDNFGVGSISKAKVLALELKEEEEC